MYKRAYNLPRPTYYLVRDFVRMYPVWVAKYNDELTHSKNPEEPSGGGVGDPTLMTAIRVSEWGSNIKAIEDGLNVVPEFYRAGVWNNVIKGEPFPKNADAKTFRHWKRAYYYKVAEDMKWI